jgi:uncharacterized protein
MTNLLRSLLVLPLVAAIGCATVPPADRAGERSSELARSGYEAFARGDIGSMMALMHPSLIWHEAESLPYGGAHRGPDAVMENVFMGLARDWEPFAAIPQEYIAAGDRVVVLGEYRATHRESGRSFVAPFAHVWRFNDGRLVEFRQLTDTGLWLAALRGD